MATGSNIDFKIPGRQAPVRAEETLPGVARITVRESFQIRPPTRGAEDLLDRTYSPNALIELEFESGAKRYTRADQLAGDLARMAPTRGGPTQTPGGPVVVPAAMGGTTRGDSEML